MQRALSASKQLSVLSRAAPGARGFTASPAKGKLHELRQYVCHTDDLPKYLALTGGDAFKPRTDASKLLAFFLVETGVNGGGSFA
jgi:hypothetical protein